MQKNTDVFFDEKQNCCYAYTNDGTKFIFDICDANVVNRQGWHLSRRGYVAGKEKRRERPLHKMLLQVDSGFDIDHINRDKLDNRRSNLRVCSHHSNCLNQSKRSTNTSGYMGVSFSKNMKKFESYIHHNGVKKSLGFFTSPEEAAICRDVAAKRIFGKYCYLNFPDKEAIWWTR